MFRRSLRIVGPCIVVLAVGPALAQKLPATSRTVFRCEHAGNIVYSDAPCPGVRRLDVEPTRGMSHDSGSERIGSDVRREMHNEQLAEALKPLFGENAQQRTQRLARARLGPAERLLCARLDRDIAATEQQERSATPTALGSTQTRLFSLRSQYRELQC